MLASTHGAHATDHACTRHACTSPRQRRAKPFMYTAKTMPTPKVLLTRRWPSEVEHHLSQRYELTVNEQDAPMDAAALKAAVASCDAVCPTVTDKLTADVLSAGAGKVKILGNYGVGVSHIDLQACRRLGIAVTNTPEVLTEATADIAITLMLMAARRAGEGERQVRAGEWTGWRPTRHDRRRRDGQNHGPDRLRSHRPSHRVQGPPRLRHENPLLLAQTRRAGNRGPDKCPTLPRPGRTAGESDFVSLHCPGGAETATSWTLRAWTA